MLLTLKRSKAVSSSWSPAAQGAEQGGHRSTGVLLSGARVVHVCAAEEPRAHSRPPSGMPALCPMGNAAVLSPQNSCDRRTAPPLTPGSWGHRQTSHDTKRAVQISRRFAQQDLLEEGAGPGYAQTWSPCPGPGHGATCTSSLGPGGLGATSLCHLTAQNVPTEGWPLSLAIRALLAIPVALWGERRPRASYAGPPRFAETHPACLSHMQGTVWDTGTSRPHASDFKSPRKLLERKLSDVTQILTR